MVLVMLWSARGRRNWASLSGGVCVCVELVVCTNTWLCKTENARVNSSKRVCVCVCVCVFYTYLLLP